MARKDMLDEIDEVVQGADLQSKDKRKVPVNNYKPKMKMKNLNIQVEWDLLIKNFTGSPSSGYMVNAIKNQMVKDGLL